METRSFEVEDFEREVLAASAERPVLVDFWAAWCGPCRVLGPVLERLAGEAGEAWTLVKVDTDANPDVAARYGIRGIPNVKLFVDGAVVDEFTGALPEHALRRWLAEALPSETKARLAEVRAALAAGDEAAAQRLLEALADGPAADAAVQEARVLLARRIALRDPERAEALATSAEGAGVEAVEVREAARTIARLARLDADRGALPEGPGRAPYEAALDALARADADAALAAFIDVIRTDRYYDDDGARRACLALFTLLGADHPAVRRRRRTFDMALY